MKKVLYIIIGIVILYVILAFVGPKVIKVERQIVINQPATLVDQKIGDLQLFHEKWNPWALKDPNMSYNFSGTPGEAGHSYSWKGNDQVGTGELTVVGHHGDSLLEKMSIEGEGAANSYFVLNEKDGSTTVTWGMTFDVGFFRRPPMMFMNMDKMMGPDFEKGLNMLKAELENAKNKMVEYPIEELQWPEVTYVGRKETVLFQNLPTFFGQNFSALYRDIQKNKINPESPPSAIFTKYDEKEAKGEVIAAVKVASGTTMKAWEKFTYPASKVLHVAYFGAYDKSAVAHVQIGNYMKKKNMKENVFIEEYVTDPGTEKDTTKWLTNIYYLIK
jgi:effector-binding domain-containing protein